VRCRHAWTRPAEPWRSSKSDAIHAQLAEQRYLATLAEQELSEHRQATEQSATALARYRLEAVSGVVAESLATTASQILSTRIEPLVNEVTHRWKRVFGERGALRLGADGRLFHCQRSRGDSL
jgi:hypothetical protein